MCCANKSCATNSKPRFKLATAADIWLVEVVKSNSVTYSCLSRNCDKEESCFGTANMRHMSSNPPPFTELRDTDSTGVPGHCHDAICSMLLELKHVETLFCQGVWGSVTRRWRQCCWPIDYFNTDWSSVMKRIPPRVFMLAAQPRICLRVVSEGHF